MGNWSALDGDGVFRFDYKIIQRPSNGAALPYQVDVYGLNAIKMTWTSPNPDTTTGWVRFEIPIQESAWTVSSGTYAQILQNVTSVRIRVRIFTDTTIDTVIGLDNIVLRGQQEVYPVSYSVLAGEEFTGSLNSLVASDDNRMTFLPDADTLMTWVQFDAYAPFLTPTVLKFFVESNATRAGLVRTIKLKNYLSGSYVQFDGRIAPPVEDLMEFDIASISNYIGTLGEMSAQIQWLPLNDEDPSSDGWVNGFDMVKWHVL